MYPLALRRYIYTRIYFFQNEEIENFEAHGLPLNWQTIKSRHWLLSSFCLKEKIDDCNTKWESVFNVDDGFKVACGKLKIFYSN